MENNKKFYINGEWVNPISPKTLEVINPANEEVITEISMGSEEDVNIAVSAAKNAFTSFSQTTREERLALFESILEIYKKRMPDLAKAITSEMGAPVNLANAAQAPAGLGHLSKAYKTLKDYKFEFEMNTTIIRKEPVGVCGLITPWNWPINQIACKVGPALAAGCTMILKPSEVAPLSAIIFSEILDKKSKLRNYFEKSKNCDVIACYEDSDINIKKFLQIKLKDFSGVTPETLNIFLDMIILKQ